MRDYSRITRHFGLNRALAFTLAAVVTVGVSAQSANDTAPVLNPDAPLTYVVKKGDTLWDIAGHFLRDPWLWPELWTANEQIANPHLIYPGDTLYLVYVDGQPRLQRTPPATIAGPRTLSGGGEMVRREPEIRVQPLSAAVPTIPINAIRDFLRGPRVISRSEYEDAPYLVDFESEHMMGASNVAAFVKRVDPEAGYGYDLVRIGERYKDPDSGKTIGYEALSVGRIEIREFDEISRAMITASDREVLRGDRLVADVSSSFESNFFPRAPESEIDATIISVYDGVTQIGQYQVVTLNRGESHGMEPGHVLTVFQRGRKVKDPVEWGKVRLPEQRAGTVMVFKTYPELSYALVMRATRALHVKDKARNPVSLTPAS